MVTQGGAANFDKSNLIGSGLAAQDRQVVTIKLGRYWHRVHLRFGFR